MSMFRQSISLGTWIFLFLVKTWASETLAGSTQLMVVLASDEKSNVAKLHLLSRTNPRAAWFPRGLVRNVVIGRAGLGTPVDAEPRWARVSDRKIEGDGRTPAGLFVLGEAFGTAPDEKPLRYGFRQLFPDSEAVDDPRSRYYNQIVRRSAVRPDWRSAERMWLPQGVYRRGIRILFNPQDVPGAGSNIFLHLRGKADSTSGCVALWPTGLREILHWVDRASKPMILITTRSNYLRRPEVGLPSLAD